MVLIFLTSVATCVYLIDPYGLYGSTRYENVNAIKPKAGTNSRLAKIYQAHRAAPDVLIVGNSRVEMGLDPQHPYFTENNLNVFNLGLPGSSLNMQYSYALDVVRTSKVQKVIIGVDFMDFLNLPTAQQNPFIFPPAQNKYNARQLKLWNGQDNPQYGLQKARDYLRPLFSLDGISHALTTIIKQSASASTLTAEGFNPAQDLKAATRNEGMAVIFSQKNQQIAQSFSRPDLSVYSQGYEWSSDFELLKQFLMELDKQDIQVFVFINPYHIQYLQLIRHHGLWSEFLDWKNTLLKAVPTQSENISLWDFSAVSPYISEAITDKRNNPYLNWYWEPAHYNKALGDVLLERLFGISDKTDFGHPLTAQKITEYRQKELALLEKYEIGKPAEAAFIKKFIIPSGQD